MTVYSSLPLSGASRPQAMAVVRGARMALEERGGAAGQYALVSVSGPSSSMRTPDTLPHSGFISGQPVSR